MQTLCRAVFQPILYATFYSKASILISKASPCFLPQLMQSQKWRSSQQTYLLDFVRKPPFSVLIFAFHAEQLLPTSYFQPGPISWQEIYRSEWDNNKLELNTPKTSSPYFYLYSTGPGNTAKYRECPCVLLT